MHRKLYSLLILMVLLPFLAACNSGGDKTGTTSDGTQAIDTTQLAPPPPARSSDTVAAVDTAAKSPVVTHTAVISTSQGDIQVELYGIDAPRTVANFVGLAKKKFYDGLAFHRIAPGFVIQGGDPLTKDDSKRSEWGTGGESIYNGAFADELNPQAPSSRRGYVTGTLAMANSGPNTNRSQFFIVISTQGASHLQHNYSIFGLVQNGMDVVKKIEASGAGGEGPKNPDRIKKITVQELPAASQMPGQPS